MKLIYLQQCVHLQTCSQHVMSVLIGAALKLCLLVGCNAFIGQLCPAMLLGARLPTFFLQLDALDCRLSVSKSFAGLLKWLCLESVVLHSRLRQITNGW